MSWLINIFFLCKIWALYVQQVLNNVPMNKDPQPNFKLCTATLRCRNLITMHFWTYILKKKTFKMCFRWRRILCGLVFWCAIVLKGTVTRFCACEASWSLVWRTFFLRLAFGEKILFHRPWDDRESYSISIREIFCPFWKFWAPYFVFLCKHCPQNSKSLRRSARMHIICCQCSYTRIKCGV